MYSQNKINLSSHFNLVLANEKYQTLNRLLSKLFSNDQAYIRFITAKFPKLHPSSSFLSYLLIFYHLLSLVVMVQNDNESP